MNFEPDPRTREFRAEMREFLAGAVTPEMVERCASTGTYHDWELHRAMAARGLIAAGWPEQYGGQGWSAWEMAVMEDELFHADAPHDALSLTMTAANAILHMGDDEQRRRVLPRVLAGEILICIGWSEPDAGSDVAAAKTRAVRDGDGWVVNGQKQFTTMAHVSDFVFLLTRTNVEAPKHRGLTTFLVPMDTPGIEVQPIHTLGGERTNATFYTDVRVPDSARIGNVDHGWEVMRVALSYEHSANWAAHLLRLVEGVARWAAERVDESGRPVLDDPTVRARLAHAAVEAEVGELLGASSASVAARGEVSDVEASMAKLYTSEALVRETAQMMDIAAASGLVKGGHAGSVADGDLERTFRKAFVRTIYAGTSEMQRTIIAQRGLGLPRS
jgi:alkylation response protein AidB-like acyl-CoA dehydrogenase